MTDATAMPGNLTSARPVGGGARACAVSATWRRRRTERHSPRRTPFAVTLSVREPFLGAFFKTDVSNTIGVIFIAALGALAGGLVIFLREICLATRSLRIGPH
jgi:hypothetical protein